MNKKQIHRQQLHNNDLIYLGQQMFRFVCDEHDVIEGVDQPDEHTEEFEPGADKNSFSRRLNILR